MNDENNENKSLTPVNLNSLTRVKNSIALTNKLLSESKHLNLGDLKGEPIWKIYAHEKSVRKILKSKFGDYIISCSEDGWIKLWDIDSGELIRENKFDYNWITALSDNLIEPETDVDYFIYAGTKSGKILLIEYDFFSAPIVIDAHSLIITDLSISKDCGLLASCSWDNYIKIWDLSSLNWGGDPWVEGLELSSSFIGHELGVNSIEFFSSKNLLVSGGKDEKVKVWQSNGELITVLHEHKHWVNAVSYCHINNLIASGSSDNSIKIWNWQDEKCLLTIKNDEWINDLSFTPDGSYLIACCYDTTIKVYETKNFKRVAVYNEHSKSNPFNHSINRNSPNWVNSVFYEPSIKNIFSTSVDGSIHKWK